MGKQKPAAPAEDNTGPVWCEGEAQAAQRSRSLPLSAWLSHARALARSHPFALPPTAQRRRLRFGSILPRPRITRRSLAPRVPNPLCPFPCVL